MGIYYHHLATASTYTCTKPALQSPYPSEAGDGLQQHSCKATLDRIQVEGFTLQLPFPGGQHTQVVVSPRSIRLHGGKPPQAAL